MRIDVRAVRLDDLDRIGIIPVLPRLDLDFLPLAVVALDVCGAEPLPVEVDELLVAEDMLRPEAEYHTEQNTDDRNAYQSFNQRLSSFIDVFLMFMLIL